MKRNIESIIILLLMTLSLVPATTITTNSQQSPQEGFQFPSIGNIISTMLTPSNYSIELYAENYCIRPVIRLGINPFLITILDNSSIFVTSIVENDTLVVNGTLKFRHDLIAVLTNDTNIEYNISYQFVAGSQYRENGMIYLSLTNTTSHILIRGHYNITSNLYNVILQSELHITGFGEYFDIVDEHLSNTSRISLLVGQLENILNVRITKIDARKINSSYYIVSINASLYAWPSIPSNIDSGSGEEVIGLSNGTFLIIVKDTIHGEFRTISDYLSALRLVGHIGILSGTRIPILLGFEYSGEVELPQFENLLLCGNNRLSIEKNESFLEIRVPGDTTENRTCNDTVNILLDIFTSLRFPDDTPISLFCGDNVEQNYTLSELKCDCTKASNPITSSFIPTTTNNESINTETTINNTSRPNNTLYVAIGIAIVILLGIVSFYKRQ